MPRVHHRKANKDYPQQGITKGDMYYYTKLKLQRGGLVKRSLTPFKQSQLTNSPFKSGFLSIGEGWDAGDKSAEAIRGAAESMTELGSEAQESFDNMPEGLQQGETGQTLENRAMECEQKGDTLNELADELEGLEDPGEFEDPDEPEQDHTYDERVSDHEELVSEFEAEQERITEEAGEAIGEMPE